MIITINDVTKTTKLPIFLAASDDNKGLDFSPTSLTICACEMHRPFVLSRQM